MRHFAYLWVGIEASLLFNILLSPVYSAGVTVKSIVKGSTVDQDGHIHIGDIILSVSPTKNATDSFPLHSLLTKTLFSQTYSWGFILMPILNTPCSNLWLLLIFFLPIYLHVLDLHNDHTIPKQMLLSPSYLCIFYLFPSSSSLALSPRWME